jgi:abequosyltransferase
MKAPILSICIATYNRAEFIGRTLDSIIPQLTDDVELVIVDGASTDNTKEVIHSYLRQSDHIRYIRLENKGGVDQDYDRSIELAFGEMCWFFTDDDLINPGAVETILTEIKNGHGLIIVNAQIRDRELSVILQERRMEIVANRVYAANEMEQFFIDALGYLSFIGAVVIRRSIWMNRERRSYFGTEFIHVGVIFQKPLTETTMIIADPLITIRYGNAQWTSRSFEIWMFKWPNLVWSFKDFSEQAKRQVSRKEPWRDFKDLIINRSEGGYNFHIYKKYFSSTQASIFWKFSALIIACFPRNVIYGFYFLYSRRNHDRRVFFDNQYARQKKNA